jgi:hypothetical protein
MSLLLSPKTVIFTWPVWADDNILFLGKCSTETHSFCLFYNMHIVPCFIITYKMSCPLVFQRFSQIVFTVSLAPWKFDIYCISKISEKSIQYSKRLQSVNQAPWGDCNCKKTERIKSRDRIPLKVLHFPTIQYSVSVFHTSQTTSLHRSLVVSANTYVLYSRAGQSLSLYNALATFNSKWVKWKYSNCIIQ